MTAIVTLPPIHMTARAYEWLTTSPTWYGYGKHYQCPEGEAACAYLYERDPDKAHVKVMKQWCASTEDIRAWALGVDYVVAWGSRVAIETWPKYTIRRDYPGPNPRLPTCTACRVLLDQAIEQIKPKTGQWLVWLPRGTEIGTTGPLKKGELRWTTAQPDELSQDVKTLFTRDKE